MADEVEVSVDVQPDTDAGGGDGGDTIVVASGPAPAGDQVSAEILAQVVQHGERITRLENAVEELAAAVSTARVTAEVAAEEVERVAEQTEEAVATLAEATEQATEEVIAETEDIAPAREHPWFARRRLMTRGDS